jgi:hypothetical protein
VLAVGATFASPALASTAQSEPWDGGAAVVSPLEELVGQVSSELAGRSVSAICNDAPEWASLAVQRGNSSDELWGYVEGMTTDGTDFVPGDVMQLSTQACAALEAYRTGARSKPCKVDRGAEVRTERYTVRVKRKVNGKVRTVLVTKTREVPVRVTVVNLCLGYEERLLGIETVAHEAQHLKGIGDEATAECYGLQHHAVVSQRFGATAAQARTMALDYFTLVYPSLDAEYRSPECRDGGALDLNLGAAFPS